MAPRFIPSDVGTMVRSARPEVELVSPHVTPDNPDPKPPEAVVSSHVPENESTNRFRIKCLDELRSVDPDSAHKLSSALDEMPRVGDLFQGFRLSEILGEGAFGTVFLAEQIGMAGRQVALKVSADLVGETQLLSQLQHTHIVPIYSAHSFGTVQAICMPFYGRNTLADWCRELRGQGEVPTSARMIVSTLQQRHATLGANSSQKSLRNSSITRSDAATLPTAPGTTGTNHRIEKIEYVDAILWIASRVAEGLSHAHQRGILHRDLKPANVLLTDDGLPMILDFNLSEDLKNREAELRARVGGTLPYMSPEQLEIFRGGTRELDPRSDLYSLGLILFQLLTGHHPFRQPKGTPAEIIDKMLADRRKSPPSLTVHNAAVSPAVESIVRRCLEADPEKRYLDAEQLREDIDLHRANRGLKYASNVSLGELLSKWLRRHPWVKAPGTVGLVCTVGLLGGVSTWLWQRDHLKREAAKELHMKSEQLFQSVTERMNQGRAMMLDPNDSPEKVRAGRELLGEALDQYQARQNPEWDSQLPVEILSIEHQEQLRRQIEESKLLVERSRKLTDPSKQPFQNLLAQQTPEQIRTNLERSLNAGVKPGNEAKIPDLSDLALRSTVSELTASGRYSEAVPYLRQAVAKKSDDHEAWYQLGCCLKMVGKTREAVSAFTAALASKPGWIEALWRRSELHDDRSALVDVETILKLDPNHVEATIHGAVLLSRLNRPQEALARLEPIMLREGVPTRVWFIRADIRDHHGDKAGAAEDRAAGIKLEPNDVQSWNARGYWRIKTQPEKALADFREAERLDPRSIHSLQNQAHVLGEKLNNPEGALAAIDRLLAFHPQYLPAVASRGVYLARLGQIENAVNQAEAAVSLSESGYSHFKAACVYARASTHQAGYKKDALSHLSKALMDGYGYDLLMTTSELNPLRSDMMFTQLASFAVLMKSMRK